MQTSILGAPSLWEDAHLHQLWEAGATTRSTVPDFPGETERSSSRSFPAPLLSRSPGLGHEASV